MKRATPHDAPNRTTCRRTLGAAMIEMMLALPLLMVIIAFLLFFGRGVVRVQHTHVLDRYEAWRHVSHTRYHRPDYETHIGASGSVHGPHANAADGHAMLNDTFFAGRAAAIAHSSDGDFPIDAREMLIDAARTISLDAGEVATSVHTRLAAGRTDQVATSHSNNVAVLQRFDGPIQHRHTRLEHDWRFVNGWLALELRWATVQGWGYDNMAQLNAHILRLSQGNSVWNRRDIQGEAIVYRPDSIIVWQRLWPQATPLGAVREAMFSEIDGSLRSMESGGNAFAGALANLYRDEPPYHGPSIGLNP